VPGVSAKLRALAVTERGVTALEYALIAAIVGVVTVGAMHGVGTSLLQNFETLVEAVSDDPERAAKADTPPPAPPAPRSARPARPTVPDMEEEEESPQGPSMASDGEGAGEAEKGEPAAMADARDVKPRTTPSGPAARGAQAGITPSGPALGPGDDGLPIAALRAPPESEDFGAAPDSSDEHELPPVPPGRESSRDSGAPWNQAASAQEAAPPSAEASPPETPAQSGRRTAAFRSAFILLLWIAFAIMLINLIWQMATRKAHEKEVEDQLEDWRPASFG